MQQCRKSYEEKKLPNQQDLTSSERWWWWWWQEGGRDVKGEGENVPTPWDFLDIFLRLIYWNSRWNCFNTSGYLLLFWNELILKDKIKYHLKTSPIVNFSSFINFQNEQFPPQMAFIFSKLKYPTICMQHMQYK